MRDHDDYMWYLTLIVGLGFAGAVLLLLNILLNAIIRSSP